MERLTEREGILVKSKFKGEYASQNILTRLAEYEDAEEQGLLLRLPTPIGSDVWKLVNQRDTFTDIPYKIVSRRSFSIDMLDYIGKTVFLTREEAEAKLAQMQKG